MSLSNKLPCEFLLLPRPPQVFSVRDFEALFPSAGTLGCMVCLAPQLFLLVYPHANVGLPSLPATALPQILSTLATRLHPSYWSGWMFLLYLLGCRTSIQFDFLAVLVFKCVVVLLLVVQGSKIYLPTPPCCLEVVSLIFSIIFLFSVSSVS